MSSNEWKSYRLDSICTKITSGGTPNTLKREYYEGTIPWLRTQEVNNNRLFDTKISITEEGLMNSSANWIPANSVIVAMYGATAGRVALTKIPLTTNQACCNLIVNNKIANCEYLFYNLFSRFREIAGMATGGAQQNLNSGMIKNLELCLPNLETQTKIASILSALDDKIELNRQTNETLEEIAQTLFKEMCLPKGDELPEGWRVGKLGEIVKITNETINPSINEALNYYHYSLPAFDDGQEPTQQLGKDILSNKYKVPNRSILISKLNPRVQRIWIVLNNSGNTSICSTEFQVLQAVESSSYCFAICVLKKNSTTEILKKMASGTSSSHQRIKPEDILNLVVVIPSHDILVKFERIIFSILQKIAENKQEIQTLTKLRDTLLPKLMRGEIEV